MAAGCGENRHSKRTEKSKEKENVLGKGGGVLMGVVARDEVEGKKRN